MFGLLFGYLLGRSSSRRNRGPYGAGFWTTMLSLGVLLMGAFIIHPILMSVITGGLFLTLLVVLFGVRVDAQDKRRRDILKANKENRNDTGTSQGTEARGTYAGSHRSSKR